MLIVTCVSTCANKVSALPISEVMEHLITMSLWHFGVHIKAGVTQLRNLFSKQLYSLCSVAENDALIDLQLQLKIYIYVKGGGGEFKNICMSNNIVCDYYSWRSISFNVHKKYTNGAACMGKHAWN